jgi:hypothetical protein
MAATGLILTASRTRRLWSERSLQIVPTERRPPQPLEFTEPPPAARRRRPRVGGPGSRAGDLRPRGGGVRPRAGGRRFRLSLRAQWALSLGVAAVLLLGLVVYVDNNNTDVPNGQLLTPKGLAEANREATILQEQDQAPQHVRLIEALAPAQAMVRAVHNNMQARINENLAGPPLKPATCTLTTAIGPRRAYSCAVLAGGVYYDFNGVTDISARRLVLCKRDVPPVPAEAVPLDPACTL